MCMHEVQYMLKMKHKKSTFVQCTKAEITTPDVILKCKSCSAQHWHSQSQTFWHKEGCTQCKMCTPATQDYDECSARRGTKALHTRTLRKKDK